MNSSLKGTPPKSKPKTAGWPPRYLSPVAKADLKRGRGDEVINFAEALCTITKDSIAGHAGEPLIFRDWQKELTRNLYAKQANGTLTHSRALIGLPRKNGKSAWLASLVLEHLVFGVVGGEAYSAAADKEQSKIIFNTVRDMIKNAPDLSEFLQVYKDSIYNPKNGTVYRALSSEAFTKEGLSATFVAFDELHAQANRELFDVLSLSMGARKEGMLVAITTAGVQTDQTGKNSICYNLYNYGKQIASKEIEDPNFFFAWWEPKSERADYRDPKVWSDANPGFGDIVSKSSFDDSLRLTLEAEFKTKRLNIWTSTSETWLPHGAWDSCYLDRTIEDHKSVVLGFDGSFNGDCTVIVAVEVGEVDSIPHLIPVQVWEKPEDGDPDWKIPIIEVEDAIREACAKWDVLEVVCDPYRWQRSIEILSEENLPMVEFPQTATRMTPATTRFSQAVLNKNLTHNGDLTMARHIGNATLRVDSRGTRLAKEKVGSTKRIDLAVASVMALERAAFHQGQGGGLPMIFNPWDLEAYNEKPPQDTSY